MNSDTAKEKDVKYIFSGDLMSKLRLNFLVIVSSV